MGGFFDSAADVDTLGLGDMSDVVLHRRLLGGSFGGMMKCGCLPGTGGWKTDCWSTRYSCYRWGFLSILMGVVVGKAISMLAQARRGACRIFRDETAGHVSAGYHA